VYMYVCMYYLDVTVDISLFKKCFWFVRAIYCIFGLFAPFIVFLVCSRHLCGCGHGSELHFVLICYFDVSCVCVCVCVCTCVCSSYFRFPVCVCVCVCMRISLHICMYVYVYIYIV
jgi:hypothetical protein